MVVAPIGFVCDHVEVLYDLDVEARAVAADAGIGFHRAAAANDHPAFIAMLVDLVRQSAGAPAVVKLVVVGGGITGLAAAHRAVELAGERGLSLDLTLLEAGDRLGGTIATERRDGFLVECGPDSFLSEKPWALALCRRLGLEDRLVRTDDRFRRTFVVWGGALHPLPEGFQLLAPTRLGPLLASRLFTWPGKLRMALDLVLPRGGEADESLGAFVRRRLGREALERVAQPLVAGIYTADPDDLSLTATMPRFTELERRERSVILALWRARAAGARPRRRGRAAPAGRSSSPSPTAWRSWCAPWAPGCRPGSVRLKARVTDVARADGRWRVTTQDGDVLARRRRDPGDRGASGRAPSPLRRSRRSRSCSKGSRTPPRRR